MQNVVEEHLDALKAGSLIRVHVEKLGQDVLLIPAAADETTEEVLEGSLEDVREKAAWAEAHREALQRQSREECSSDGTG